MYIILRFVYRFLFLLGIILCSSISHAEKYKTSDEAIIGYEVVGNGPPLVLLHSGMMSREDMRRKLIILQSNIK